ncbi:uncharacterized protein B0P05DRAFT_475581 [Gilbertella persicaria]|uniref:uncharacterized protein n=1 Tax=Gilbertella persicaria TaxID=101096 RepID=UPI0022203BA0|nr:uncharacterized protein B0P05DRAFT_475581 [Gilbertella persicaria]KAI8067023.1 hypothetical protein B0P05DRAFT_475581 [Gilbertella persicaria]
MTHSSCRINSPSPYSRLDSYDQKQELENNFCKDFSCCGLRLKNLHILLEHYEEFHSSQKTTEEEDKSSLLIRRTVTQETQTIDLTHRCPLLKYPFTKEELPDTKSTPNSSSNEDQTDRPYRCQVSDCDKAYKNANGLKYHRLHGHCTPNDGTDLLDSNKPYVCSLEQCQKRYKNLNGLKYHMRHTHAIQLGPTPTSCIDKDERESEEEEEEIHGIKRKLSCGSFKVV